MDESWVGAGQPSEGGATGEEGALTTPTAQATPLSAILLLVGGGLAAVAAFLPWAAFSLGGDSLSVKGVEGWEGKVTLACGVGMIILGGAILSAARGGRRLSAGWVGVATGLVVVGIPVYDMLTLKTQVTNEIISKAPQIAQQAGQSLDVVKALIQSLIDSGAITVSLRMGIFLALIGGLCCVSGGILNLREGREASAALAAPAPPSGTVAPGAPGSDPWATASGWASSPPQSAPPPPPSSPPPSYPPPAPTPESPSAGPETTSL